MSTTKDIVAEAHRLAEKSKRWADLSNALFDPLDGLVTKRFSDASERAASPALLGWRKTAFPDLNRRLSPAVDRYPASRRKRPGFPA